VTDPARAAVLVDVRFESLTGEPYRVYVLGDPALSNTGDDDTGSGATASDATNASALATAPALTRTSVGYMGASGRLDRPARRPRGGLDPRAARVVARRRSPGRAAVGRRAALRPL